MSARWPATLRTGNGAGSRPGPLALVFALLAGTAHAADDRETDMFGVADEDPPAEQSDRERGMFGADDATTDPTRDPADGGASGNSNGRARGREDDIFGDVLSGGIVRERAATPGMFSLLQDAENFLTVGGQLFLRFNGAGRDGDGIRDMQLSAPSLFDAFMDVRPTDRVRGFTQVRLLFDPTVDPNAPGLLGQQQVPFQLLLDQAWIKFDLGRVAYVTAGRQRIRWGTGRFWNPTDFVNQDIRNSVDFFDQRIGQDLVKIHFPLESLGWNLYLVAMTGQAQVLGELGLAARAEFLVGETEIALSTMARQGAPIVFGADISTGIWIFDLRAEGILQQGLRQRRFKGELDLEPFPPVLPEEMDTSQDWFFQGTFGAEASFKYTDADTFSVGVEYFYNQAGYDGANLYPWLILNGAFVPLYNGQHYLAAYAFARGPRQFDQLRDFIFTVSTLGNLSDRSFLSRVDVAWRLLQYVTLNVFAAAHWGDVGEFRFGLDIPPLPLVPGLEEGFLLPPSRFDAGTALRINF
jgi:hypothetical protein